MQVALSALWLPILLSTVAVYIASSLIWAVIQYHNSDWRKLPDEEGARAALKGVAPGQYSVPHSVDGKARQSEDWRAKYAEGPNILMVVFPSGPLSMGKQLGQWVLYCLVMSTLIAYVAGTALPAGADYMKVFQLVATVAILGYAGYSPAGSIWFGHLWSRTAKDILDGVVYGLLTAGVFGWLWPQM